MMNIIHLRCEYLENPIGIDVAEPRLSWKLQTDRICAKQTAYQIQCSRNNEFDVSDMLWDTIKVESDQSILVQYNGQILKSRDRVFWRVRIWDEFGTESDWSTVEFWEMGLLETKDWKAKWIDPEEEIDPEEFQPSPFLRREFEITESIETARLYITAHGLYETWINGGRVGIQYFTPGRTQYDKRFNTKYMMSLHMYVKVAIQYVSLLEMDGGEGRLDLEELGMYLVNDLPCLHNLRSILR